MKKPLVLCALASALLLASCGGGFESRSEDNAFHAYKSILNYVFDNYESSEGGCSVGRVSTVSIPLTGSASLKFSTKSADDSRIEVSYGIPHFGSAVEDGVLSEWGCGELSDTTGCYPYCVTARWQPEGSSGGEMLLYVERDNTVRVSIVLDGDGYYWCEFLLPSVDTLAAMLSNAYLESIALEMESLGPDGRLEPLSLYKAENETGEAYLLTDIKGTSFTSVYARYYNDGAVKFVEGTGRFHIYGKGKKARCDSDSGKNDPFIERPFSGSVDCSIDGGRSITFYASDKDKSQGVVFNYVGADSSIFDALSCPPASENRWLLGEWSYMSESNSTQIYYFYPNGQYLDASDFPSYREQKGYYTVFDDHIELYGIDGFNNPTIFYYKAGQWISYSNDRKYSGWRGQSFVKKSWITPDFHAPGTGTFEGAEWPGGLWREVSGGAPLMIVPAVDASGEGTAAFTVSSFDVQNSRIYKSFAGKGETDSSGHIITAVWDAYGYDCGMLESDSPEDSLLSWVNVETERYIRCIKPDFDRNELELMAMDRSCRMLADEQQKIETQAAVRKLAANSWAIGEWKNSAGEIITIKADGTVIKDGSPGGKVVMGDGADGKALIIFDWGGEYYIDWTERSISDDYDNLFVRSENSL